VLKRSFQPYKCLLYLLEEDFKIQVADSCPIISSTMELDLYAFQCGISDSGVMKAGSRLRFQLLRWSLKVFVDFQPMISYTVYLISKTSWYIMFRL
jgi:hypothetical protein